MTARTVTWAETKPFPLNHFILRFGEAPARPSSQTLDQRSWTGNPLLSFILSTFTPGSYRPTNLLQFKDRDSTS